MVRKRILKGISKNYRINYSTEFDLYIDIGSIVYVFYKKILFLLSFKIWCEDSKKAGVSKET